MSASLALPPSGVVQVGEHRLLGGLLWHHRTGNVWTPASGDDVALLVALVADRLADWAAHALASQVRGDDLREAAHRYVVSYHGHDRVGHAVGLVRTLSDAAEASGAEGLRSPEAVLALHVLGLVADLALVPAGTACPDGAGWPTLRHLVRGGITALSV